MRNGTVNVFMFIDVNRPWRHAKVTDQRTCIDFAECMRDLVDDHYPEAERIRAVLDKLSVHSAAAPCTRRLNPRKPVGSLARIESTSRRTRQLAQHDRDRHDGRPVPRSSDPDKATLIKQIAAWECRRNAEKASIDWASTVDRARQKVGRAYPQPATRSTIGCAA